MKYYFIKKPKKLIEIYDQTLGILSEMDSRFAKEAAIFQARQSNLWPGKEFYCFPGPIQDDSTRFKVPLTSNGIYTLAFTATLFPFDQSVNPRLSGYTCSPDSINTGRRKYIETMNYIKDGRPHNYSYRFRVPVKSTLYLKGTLFDFDNNSYLSENHGSFENISITYTYAVD